MQRILRHMGERWFFFNDVLRCKGNLWQPCFVSQLLNDIQVNYLTCIYLSFLQMKNVFSNDIQVDYLTCSRTHSSQARRSFLSRTARTPLSQATACIFSGDTYLQRLRKRKIQRWDKDSACIYSSESYLLSCPPAQLSSASPASDCEIWS